MLLQLSIVHCDNHLDTLGVDLFALLVPVDDRLGIASGLANKWCHTPWHSNLVCGNLGELRRSWGTRRKKSMHKNENWYPYPEDIALTVRGEKSPCWPGPISLSVTGHNDLCSDGRMWCLLPGYHLEGMLKDFLWVINKRCGQVSEESLSLSLSLPPGQAILVLQAALTHVSRGECWLQIHTT